MATKVKVYEIKDVRLTRYRSDPPKLLIEVDATVLTSGYTAPELVEYVYVQPPPGGVYEFDFCATPPAGPSADVISPISVKHISEPMPKDLKGVKVYASHNSLVEILGIKTSSGTVCVKNQLTDEGVECQSLRSTDGELYTLVGDLNGFQTAMRSLSAEPLPASLSACKAPPSMSVGLVTKRREPSRVARPLNETLSNR